MDYEDSAPWTQLHTFRFSSLVVGLCLCIAIYLVIDTYSYISGAG